MLGSPAIDEVGAQAKGSVEGLETGGGARAVDAINAGGGQEL